ncbi:MAG: amidohydrolase family protein [Bacteroidales bacterium]|jgi:cytosine/adenosine deaminase-related metal-dependent hydrolase|nr:amidohydrolase family protein [Bacteroidales bacterium]
MRRISAQYIFTSAGKPLKRGIVTVDGDGTVISVEDTGGNLPEYGGTEFYNGIIIPGLVNCHAHLELSHMRGEIPPGGGLGSFITSVRDRREASPATVIAAAAGADREMLEEGIVACGDISNNTLTARIKSESEIKYITFAEVFGLDPAVAESRMRVALEVIEEMHAARLPAQITPHSLYSVSEPLSGLIREHLNPGAVISVHFLESDDERKMTHNHVEAALELAGMVSGLLLVHNTVITREEAERVAMAGNTWFCLCPSSNLHISGLMPPVAMLNEVTGRIVAGTDSLASSDRLSMITGLRLLHDAAPRIPVDEIIRWGTINGARALGTDATLGSLEPGKRPGLLLVEQFDLLNMRLIPESRVRRLI